MGILREYNLGSMDKYRSLKNSDSNTNDSFIDKKEGFQYNQINSRLTDVERFAKLLTSKQGLKFQGNQALLQQGDTLKELSSAAKKPGGGFNFKGLVKAVGKKALKTAVNNVSSTASILAQIPVNGTGTHFIRGLVPSGYLQSGAPRETGIGRFLAEMGVGGGVNGAKSALNGDPIGPTSGPLNANTIQPDSPWDVSSLAGEDRGSTFLGNKDLSIPDAKSLKDNLKSAAESAIPGGIPKVPSFLKKGQGNTSQGQPIDVEDTTKEKLEGTTLSLGDSESTPESKFLKPGEGNTNQDLPINVEDTSTEKLEGSELDLGTEGEEPSSKLLKPGEGNTSQDEPIAVEDKSTEKLEGTELDLGTDQSEPETTFLKPGEGNTSQDEPIEVEDKSTEKLEGTELDLGTDQSEPETTFLKPGEGNTNQDEPIEVEDKSTEKLEGTELDLGTEGSNPDDTYLRKSGNGDPLLGRSIVKNVQRAKEDNPDSNLKTKIFFDNLATQDQKLTEFQVEGGEGKLKTKFSVLTKDEFLKYQLRDGKTYNQSPLYIQTKYSMGDQGSRENSGPDLINALAEQDDESTLKKDLIPFYFNILGAQAGNELPENKFIQFRALLDSFTDDFTGNWSGTQYIGRAEEFYTYQGFKREISLGFKLAAFSRNELIPLYKKLNRLAGSTAPTYNEGGFFMRGTLVQLKVGDYLDKTTGFISSVGLSWDKNYSWETDEEGLGTQKLPHILNVSVSFTPIHDFEAKTNIDLEEEVYIGRKTFPEPEQPEPQPQPSGETYEFYSSGGTYTIDKATNKVVAVNGQPTNYVNGGFAYKADGNQAIITRVDGVDSEL